MKKVLLFLTEIPGRKDLKFFYDVKNYLNEKKQNKVLIYWLGGKNSYIKNRLNFKDESALINFVKRSKIDVMACNSPLRKNALKELKKEVYAVGALNFKGNDDYDFRIFLTGHDESAMIEYARKLSIVDKLNWDSNFFGINIARFNHYTINKRLMELTLTVCKRLAIKCLYFRSNSNDKKSIELCEKHGFHLANIRVTYVLEKSKEYNKIGKNYNFRQGNKNDILWLIKVSRDAYTNSRYYFDKNFSKEICDKFYIAWVKKIANSMSQKEKIFILEKSKKAVAYIGSIEVGDAVEIELIAVDSAFRGRGIGKKIVREFIRHYQKVGQRRFRVVTQGRNIAALRLYQSCGFIITEEQLDYHKWFKV